jgi:hypothetical protein
MNDNRVYIVAVCYNSNFSLTVRCLDRSPHFRRRAGNPNCIYDSRESTPRMFSILFEGSQTQAEQFAHVVAAAYSLVGVERGQRVV